MRRACQAALAALGVLGALGPAAGAEPGYRLEDLVVRRFDVGAGLAHPSVRAIAQTPDGYLWIATDGGLSRFDGASFTTFDGESTPRLASTFVQALFVDAMGALWVGSRGGGDGLLRVRGRRFESVPDRTIASGNADVLAMTEGPPGVLWTTGWKGLTRIDGDRAQGFGGTGSGGPGESHATLTAPDGTIWFAGMGEVVEYRDGRFARHRFSGYDRVYITSLAVEPDGTLWIGTADRGLGRLRAGRFEPQPVPALASVAVIRSLWRDGDGALWIGTSNGLARLAGGRVERLASGPLDGTAVTALFRDREQAVWAGTANRGLLQLTRPKFVKLTAPPQVPLEHASSVFAARDGSLWIGASGALWRLRGDQARRYGSADGLCVEAIRALAEDHQGRLLVSGFGRPPRVCRLEGERFDTLGPADGLSESSSVWSVLEDSAGRIWAGGWTLYRFQGQRFDAVAGGPSSANVFVIAEDRDRAVWAGSRRGLFRVDGAGVRRFDEQDGLADQHVRAFHQAADGTLWLGTLHGLTRGRGGRFEALGPREGFFDQPVFGILEDDERRLWMCTSRGVLRSDGRTRSGAGMSYVRYGVADGLPSDECFGEGGTVATRAADGRLYFATSLGIAVLDPRRLGAAPVPPVTVERVLVDERDVDADHPPPVESRRRAIRIEYTAPSTTAAHRLRFRYRLDGFDAGWVEAGARRSAQYTNLPPRSYRFVVTAASEDGVWSERPASVAFAVLPAWYETLAFRAALALAALLLAWGAHAWRLRIVKARHRAVLDERARMARELHDTLAQGFTALAIQLETADRRIDSSPHKVRENLDQARSVVRDSVSEMRRAVWALRPESLERSDLGGAFEELAARLGTDSAVSVAVEGTPRPLSQDTELALVRIGQEALTNALKHARARHIELTVIYGAGHVALRVIDDGVGLAESADDRPGHFGLRGMRERVLASAGRIEFGSREGRGTEVFVELPAP